jgi:hypothetical protein
MSQPFQVIVLSDLHVTDTGSGRLLPLWQKIKSTIKEPNNNTKAVLMCGDLTDGSDSGQVTDTQNNNFVLYWLDPLNTLMDSHGGRVHACLGNHDSPRIGNLNPSIINTIDDNCGDVSYNSFDIQDVHFACVYLHPSHIDGTMLLNTHFVKGVLLNSLLWLGGDLLTHKDQRIILFWHFDFNSDWWNQTEKDLLWNVIKGYNIQHIFTGHIHSTFTYLYKDGDPKQIRCSCVGGGDYFGYVNITSNSVDVNFVKADGTKKAWVDLHRTLKVISESQDIKCPVPENQKYLTL